MEAAIARASSAQELFENYTIAQLSSIKYQLSQDVSAKKLELRSLVGNKYRDLLKVADNIIDMGPLSVSQNNDLVDLTFSKSNYPPRPIGDLVNNSANNSTNKSSNNLKNYKQFVSNKRIKHLEKSNRPIILKNLIHDLKRSLLELNQTLKSRSSSSLLNASTQSTDDVSTSSALNNLSSSLDALSAQFLIIGKKFYLILDLFDLDQSHYSNDLSQFNNLKDNFIKLIELQIYTLTIDNENEFVLNLIISYIIITGSSLLDTFKFFLSVRLKYLNTSISSSSSLSTVSSSAFQDNLNYIFNTINYAEIFKSKLSTSLVKLFYSNNSMIYWFQSIPIYKKWENWLNLNEYKLTFKLSINDIKTSLNSKTISQELASWKLEIGNTFYTFFDNLISQMNNINDLTSLINKFLNSFKKFTSLIDLTFGDSSVKLINIILKNWETKFNEVLKEDLVVISETSKDVLTYLSTSPVSDTMTASSMESDDILFKYDENIDDYIYKITNNKYINNSISDNLTKIEKCNELLISFSNSLGLLNKLSAQLIKPVLSIDDYEDDSYWSDLSKEFSGNITKIYDYKINLIKKYVVDFFSEAETLTTNLNTTDGSVSIDNLIKFIRILIELSSRIDSNSNLSTDFKSTIESFNLKSQLSKLISDILQLITKNLSSKCLTSLTTLLEARQDSLLTSSSSQREDVILQYPEVQVWDTYGAQRWKVPGLVSLDFQLLLFRLCKNLINGGNESKDYSDIYLLQEFDTVKKDLIHSLFQKIVDSLEGLDKIESKEEVTQQAEEEVREEEKEDKDEESDEEDVVMSSTVASDNEPLKQAKEIISLLSYTDLLTLTLLQLTISKPLNEIDPSSIMDSSTSLTHAIEKLTKLNENFISKDYLIVINRSIIENFKSSNLLYNPLHN